MTLLETHADILSSSDNHFISPHSNYSTKKKKKKKRREKVSTFKEVCENLIYNLSKQLSDFIKHHMHFVNDHVF